MEREGEEVPGILGPILEEYRNPDFGLKDFMDDEGNLDPTLIDLISSRSLDSEIGAGDQLLDFDEAVVNHVAGVGPDSCSRVNEELQLNEEEQQQQEELATTSSKSAQKRKKRNKSDRSRTLIVDRKRRNQMKKKIYGSRSLVPNITKMDKASIVGEVLYVQDWQKQDNKLKSDISGFDSSCKNKDNYKHQGRSYLHNSKKVNASILNYPIIKKIYKMEVFQVEEGGFYVRIVSNRCKGIVVLLYKALESLSSFNVRSSNIAAASENYVLTFNFHVLENGVDMDLPSLKIWIAGVFLSQGFDLEILP